MVKNNYRLTRDGVSELETELAKLVAQKPKIAERIRLAREQGDLAENADYQIAKEDLSRLETREREVKRILQHVELITGTKKTTTVGPGATVKLKNGGNTTLTYKIVGSIEADPMQGKISESSPIGKALLGKAKGDEVVIKTPVQSRTYTVISVS